MNRDSIIPSQSLVEVMSTMKTDAFKKSINKKIYQIDNMKNSIQTLIYGILTMKLDRQEKITKVPKTFPFVLLVDI